MKLTAKKVLSLKSKDKTYLIADGHGLSLQVNPNGNKYWRFRYYYQEKPKICSLGIYPDITLQQARTEREKARALVKQDLDIAVHRREQKLLIGQSKGNTFEALILEWIEHQSKKWTDTYKQDFYRRLGMPF